MCKLIGRKQDRRSQLFHRLGMMLSAAVMLALIAGCGGAKVVHVVTDRSQ